MEQLELPFRSLPDNPFTYGIGNWRLYEHLKQFGEVTLYDLHHILNVDTARIRCDIKPYLRAHGYDVKWRPMKDERGKSLYQVVKPHSLGGDF